VVESLEHHLGNALVIIGSFLNYLVDHRLEFLTEQERGRLSQALEGFRRVEGIKNAVRRCEYAVLCPLEGRSLGWWRQRVLRWVLPR
jgi:hypothetical protein